MRFLDGLTIKRVVLAIGLVGLVVSSQMNAETCAVLTRGVPEAFDAARAVFIGEVVQISPPLSLDPKASMADRFYRVKFKVSYSWKGAGFKEFGVPDLVVFSSQGPRDACLSSSWGSFVEGKKYLVYADETDEKKLVVQVGYRTAQIANASEDLKELERMSRPSLRFQPRVTTKDYSQPALY